MNRRNMTLCILHGVRLNLCLGLLYFLCPFLMTTHLGSVGGLSLNLKLQVTNVSVLSIDGSV